MASGFKHSSKTSKKRTKRPFAQLCFFRQKLVTLYTFCLFEYITIVLGLFQIEVFKNAAVVMSM